MQKAFEEIKDELKDSKRKVITLRGNPDMDDSVLCGWISATDKAIETVDRIERKYASAATNEIELHSMTTEQMQGLCEIIKHHTVKEQELKAIEECRELVEAIILYQKGDATISDLVDELADVLIMCNQLMIIHQCRDDVEQMIDFKIDRQLGREEMKKSEQKSIRRVQ